MTLIVDTRGLVALLNRNDEAHTRVKGVVESEEGRLIVPDLVLAETDYRVLRNLGSQVEDAFLTVRLDGADAPAPLEDADLIRALELVRQFSEHGIGLTDASIVATAERLETDRILTWAGGISGCSGSEGAAPSSSCPRIARVEREQAIRAGDSRWPREAPCPALTPRSPPG